MIEFEISSYLDCSQEVRECGLLLQVFFFKQKTAYEMRISDWSSDVCSSDLDRGAARQLADAALQGLAHAQQADDVAAVGVEAQLPRRQRARAGGQERLARGIDGGAVELGADAHALVLDLPHHLAAVVLVHRRAEMAAEAVPDAAALLLVVTADLEPAHLDHAGTVLQFLTHVVKERRGTGQRKAVAFDVAPVDTLRAFDGGVDLLQHRGRSLLERTSTRLT